MQFLNINNEDSEFNQNEKMKLAMFDNFVSSNLYFIFSSIENFIII